MNARRPVRNWDANVNVALIFAAVAVVLVVAALVSAVVIDPPLLGWVGFALASAIVVSLAAAATLLVPRMRFSAARPAVATDQAHRLLVVADAYCSWVALCDAIEARLGDAVAVHHVVPVRVSHLHFLANDELEEERVAHETMSSAVGLLRRRGISATGGVGSDKPLESMTDALARFPATEVLLALPPEEDWYWLERDLLPKARALTERPITQTTVVSAQPAASPHQPAPGSSRQASSSSELSDRTTNPREGVRTRCH